MYVCIYIYNIYMYIYIYIYIYSIYIYIYSNVDVWLVGQVYLEWSTCTVRSIKKTPSCTSTRFGSRTSSGVTWCYVNWTTGNRRGTSSSSWTWRTTKHCRPYSNKFVCLQIMFDDGHATVPLMMMLPPAAVPSPSCCCCCCCCCPCCCFCPCCCCCPCCLLPMLQLLLPLRPHYAADAAVIWRCCWGIGSHFGCVRIQIKQTAASHRRAWIKWILVDKAGKICSWRSLNNWHNFTRANKRPFIHSTSQQSTCLDYRVLGGHTSISTLVYIDHIVELHLDQNFEHDQSLNWNKSQPA